MPKEPMTTSDDHPTGGHGRRRPSPRRALSVTVSALAFLASATSSTASEPSAAKKGGLGYNHDIRPILSDNCFSCHGPDKNKRKAKLRLDVREVAVEKEAIIPGKPDESELVKRIYTTDADDVMPPPETHKTLTPEQKEMLKRWIAQGAEYEPHWAYVKPVRPAIPVQKIRVRTPIDASFLPTLESRRIQAS